MDKGTSNPEQPGNWGNRIESVLERAKIKLLIWETILTRSLQTRSTVYTEGYIKQTRLPTQLKETFKRIKHVSGILLDKTL